jgi:hypothetical protein
MHASFRVWEQNQAETNRWFIQPVYVRENGRSKARTDRRQSAHPLFLGHARQATCDIMSLCVKFVGAVVHPPCAGSLPGLRLDRLIDGAHRLVGGGTGVSALARTSSEVFASRKITSGRFMPIPSNAFLFQSQVESAYEQCTERSGNGLPGNWRCGIAFGQIPFKRSKTS